MKKFLITIGCIVIVLAGTFSILFFGNVGDFRVWFMETTELLLPRPIHIKTLEDVQESFDIHFPSQAEIKDFTIQKRYTTEYQEGHEEEKINVTVPYRYYLEVTIKEQYLDDFLSSMRSNRRNYRVLSEDEFRDDIILTPAFPDINAETANKKIQYEFESVYSVKKYECVNRGRHYIQITEPEDGFISVYCTWFF